MTQSMTERLTVDMVSDKHIKINDKLLMKAFERYLKHIPESNFHDPILCRLINESNRRCRNAMRGGIFNKRAPKKTPSVIVNKSMHVKSSPKKGKTLNDSMNFHENFDFSWPSQFDDSIKEVAKEQLEEIFDKSAGPSNFQQPGPSHQNQNLLSPFHTKNPHSNQQSSLSDENLIKFSESEMKEIGNLSVVDPPPGFQLPPKRVIPLIQLPHESSNFGRPLKVSTPARFSPNYFKTSTPLRQDMLINNQDPSFSFTLPLSNRSNIKQITCNENFTPKNLSSIVEIIKNLSIINETGNNSHSISISSRSANLPPGKYELFKVIN